MVRAGPRSRGPRSPREQTPMREAPKRARHTIVNYEPVGSPEGYEEVAVAVTFITSGVQKYQIERIAVTLERTGCGRRDYFGGAHQNHKNHSFGGTKITHLGDVGPCGAGVRYVCYV